MRVMTFGLSAAALLTADVKAADINSANYLLPACRDFLRQGGKITPFILDQGICVGMIEGLAYVSHLLPLFLSSCPENAVTTGQKVRVVIAYIERHPQRMHEDFRRLAGEAMHEAWPCPPP
jgi:hypothetical protein